MSSSVNDAVARNGHPRNGKLHPTGEAGFARAEPSSAASGRSTDGHKTRVLVVYGSLSSFVRTDLDILRSEYSVRELHFRRDGAWLPVSLLRAIAGVLWADLIVSWFGSIHALFPFLIGRALGRKCTVVAGGYDVASEPDIGYGNMRGGLRRWVGLLVFRLAHRVLAISQSAAAEAISHVGVPAGKVDVIELGIAERGRDDGEPAPVDRRGVITVGIVNQSNLTRKGLSTFVAAATYLPEIPFTVIGRWRDDAVGQLRAAAHANVEFVDWLPDELLSERMRAAAVYVQASAHEAFGVALAEAMLQGCVPVVTDRGSLPEVVGNVGFYVPYGDPAGTAAAIRLALSAPPALAEQARQRILSRFAVESRRIKLVRALNAVVQ